jgi:hypothetical protein
MVILSVHVERTREYNSHQIGVVWFIRMGSVSSDRLQALRIPI